MSDRKYPRIARINEVVHEVLADELERMSDPRLDLVTITGVQVSTDLKSARVFYSSLHDDPLGDPFSDESVGSDVTPGASPEEVEGETAKALESARRHLQSSLGRQVRLKYVPRLAFEEDSSIRTGQRIEALLRDLHEGDPDEMGPPEAGAASGAVDE